MPVAPLPSLRPVPALLLLALCAVRGMAAEAGITPVIDRLLAQ